MIYAYLHCQQADDGLIYFFPQEYDFYSWKKLSGTIITLSDAWVKVVVECDSFGENQAELLLGAYLNGVANGNFITYRLDCIYYERDNKNRRIRKYLEDDNS